MRSIHKGVGKFFFASPKHKTQHRIFIEQIKDFMAHTLSHLEPASLDPMRRQTGAYPPISMQGLITVLKTKI